MTYTLDWHLKVQKFLRKLPKDISARIVLKAQVLQENPFHYLERYEGDKVYKFRVGDYRLLVDVDNLNRVVKIRVIGHRSNIYNRV